MPPSRNPPDINLHVDTLVTYKQIKQELDVNKIRQNKQKTTLKRRELFN